jgi:hypothetical protein
MKDKSVLVRALYGVTSAMLALPATAGVAFHELPMLDCQGIACTEVATADGKTMRMILDTGNVRPTLDRARAARYGISTQPFVGPDGKAYPQFSVAVAKGVSMGGAELGDVQMIAYDAPAATPVGQELDADGKLTYPVFRDRIVELDYAKRVVRVSETLSEPVPCEGNCARLQLITFGKKGPPVLVSNGFQINGKEVLAQVDTMFTGTAIVYPHAVEKLGLALQTATAAREFFPFTDGGVDMLKGIGSLAFGRSRVHGAPIYFATEKVHLPDELFDATVGVGFFRDRVVTINLRDKWIKVEDAAPVQ